MASLAAQSSGTHTPPDDRPAAGAMRALTAGLCALSLAFTGCGLSGGDSAQSGGESQKEGNTIFADALAAMRTAHSAHLQSSGSGMLIDADLTDGNFGGSVWNGGKLLNLRVKGTASWIKAAAPFWEAQSPGLGACLADKWIIVPNDPTTKPITDAAQIADFKQDAANFETAGIVSKGGTSTIGRMPVIELKGPAGSMFVALEGRPYPMRISGSGQGAPRYEFTSWDKAAPVNAPDDAIEPTTAVGVCNRDRPATTPPIATPA